MEINSLKLKLFKMTILNFNVFMKKQKLKNDIVNEMKCFGGNYYVEVKDHRYRIHPPENIL